LRRCWHPEYPARPLRLVVGFLAGGPSDIPARFIADRLATSLGKTVVVENRPGAGSLLGTQEMLAQPRDGHTLLACSTYDPVNTLLYRKARYKVADIAPVSLIARYDYGIAARLSGPAQTFEQPQEYTKANPGKLNYGVLGVGAPQTLVGKKLKKLAPPISVMPHVEAKQVRLISVTGSSRFSSAPDVPTRREMGVPIQA
jgi:tripartite-type tricarboxylate transporter receptor subunit TctC